MYLDTDIILALVKETDWLKPHVNLDLIKDPKTSAFAIIEAELIMDREYGREFVQNVLKTIEVSQIKIVPLDEKVVKKSSELLGAYSQLNIFDSVHAAFSILENETILSTDRIFKKIPGVKHIDPRDFVSS